MASLLPSAGGDANDHDVNATPILVLYSPYRPSGGTGGQGSRRVGDYLLLLVLRPCLCPCD